MAPDKREIFRAFEALPHARGGLRIRPRDQHVARVFEQAPGDGDNLLRRLAFTEDHLRHAVAQRAMVVHLGEAQILERHVAQAVQRAVHIHCAGAHLFEQLPKLLLVHTARITGDAFSANIDESRRC